MIHKLIGFALRQKFVVLALSLAMLVAGAWAFRSLPVDAYPDLSPPKVEVITQWEGHASEEIERLITIPLETAVNGAPGLRVMRSMSLYGLSDVTLIFDDNSSPYFNREQIFQRLADAELPGGVTPSLAPLFSPSGLIYRYVLESPDRSARGAQGDPGLGAVPAVQSRSRGSPTTRASAARPRQYHVVLDPNALTLPRQCRRCRDRARQQQPERRRRVLPAGRPVLLRARARPTHRYSTTSVAWSSRPMTACRSTSKTSARSTSATRRGSGSSATWTMTTPSRACCSCAPATRRRRRSTRSTTTTRYLNDHVLPKDVQSIRTTTARISST